MLELIGVILFGTLFAAVTLTLMWQSVTPARVFGLLTLIGYTLSLPTLIYINPPQWFHLFELWIIGIIIIIGLFKDYPGFDRLTRFDNGVRWTCQRVLPTLVLFGAIELIYHILLEIY